MGYRVALHVTSLSWRHHGRPNDHTAPQDTWRISDRPLRKRRTTGQPRYFMLSSHMVVHSGWGPSDDAIVQKLRVRCAGNNCVAYFRTLPNGGGVRRNRVSWLDDETHRGFAVRPAVAPRSHHDPRPNCSVSHLVTDQLPKTPTILPVITIVQLTQSPSGGSAPPLPNDASKYFESPSRAGAGQTSPPGDRIRRRNNPRKEKRGDDKTWRK
ncbi:hypothetical protein B296_00024506 [Ensete ventricosum]|uniref:Uncharacterized protein n=1 Tax=Ensete ventricosum TaxID=4639 RepID=A0A426YPJ7_ENSVE|nr:hypothetical protein B296_00024506 [Ensete ventricosum]